MVDRVTYFNLRLAELDAFIAGHGRWPKQAENPSLYQWASTNNKCKELRSRRAALLLNTKVTKEQSTKDRFEVLAVDLKNKRHRYVFQSFMDAVPKFKDLLNQNLWNSVTLSTKTEILTKFELKTVLTQVI